MDARPPPAKRRKQYAGVYQRDWGRVFNGVIVPSKLGENHAWCVPCSRDVKVAASGIYDVREHIKSKAHIRKVESGRQHLPVNTFFNRPVNTPDNIINAEIMFSYFVAEHNLPAAIADHFTDLAQRLFPDSEVAKKFRCKRTKTTQIVKRCLASESTKPVIERCKTGPFSIMIDESTDRNSDKRLAVLVRFYDVGTSRAHTRMLNMPVCNDGTSQGIFKVMDDCLR